MSVHDTIGDFITVIRNAGNAGKRLALIHILTYVLALQTFFRKEVSSKTLMKVLMKMVLKA